MLWAGACIAICIEARTKFKASNLIDFFHQNRNRIEIERNEKHYFNLESLTKEVALDVSMICLLFCIHLSSFFFTLFDWIGRSNCVCNATKT